MSTWRDLPMVRLMKQACEYNPKLGHTINVGPTFSLVEITYEKAKRGRSTVTVLGGPLPLPSHLERLRQFIRDNGGIPCA